MFIEATILLGSLRGFSGHSLWLDTKIVLKISIFMWAIKHFPKPCCYSFQMFLQIYRFAPKWIQVFFEKLQDRGTEPAPHWLTPLTHQPAFFGPCSRVWFHPQFELSNRALDSDSAFNFRPGSLVRPQTHFWISQLLNGCLQLSIFFRWSHLNIRRPVPWGIRTSGDGWCDICCPSSRSDNVWLSELVLPCSPWHRWPHYRPGPPEHNDLMFNQSNISYKSLVEWGRTERELMKL